TAAMANGHRSIAAGSLLHEHHGDRLADDFTAADDDDMGPGRGNLMPYEYLLNAVRSTWQEKWAALDNAADVGGMEGIDVLKRQDRVQNAGRIDSLGQRQLHQDAMHGRVTVQAFDQRQEIVSRRLGGQAMQATGQSILLAGPLLVADVDLAGRIFANQDRGKAWLHTGAMRELTYLGCDFGTDFFRQRFAVQKDCSHAWADC